MLATLVLTALCAPQNPPPRVVVNELSYDDAGVDDQEFVELHNAEAVALDLGAWKIEARDAGGAVLTYVLPAGSIIRPAGLLLCGAPSLAGVDVPLARPNGASVDLFANGPHASITLVAPDGTTVDQVDYRTLGSGRVAAEGDGLPGACVAAGSLPHSYQRVVDGQDTDANGIDFACLPWTPGATNDRPAGLRLREPFDGLAAGSVLGAFGGSFDRPTVIDPTRPGPANPRALPPSPQGGHAASFGGPTSSGNHAPLLAAPVRDLVVECLAWIEGSPPSSPTDAESWTLGIRGSSDSLGALPFVDPRLTAVTGASAPLWQSGCTGVAWVHQRTSTYNALYLVDWNDGGDDFQVLHVEPVIAGVNDGWQRLALRAIGDRVDAQFGSVQVAAQTTTTQTGGVYLSWGESLLDDRERRPPTVDALRIEASLGGIRQVGSGTPHTGGQPVLDASSLAYPGSGRFALEARDLLPNGAVGILTGFAMLGSPIDLAALGAQPGAQVFVRPDFGVGFQADGAGELRIPLALPGDPTLIGATLGFQALAVDPALPYPLPLATSAALEVVISN